MRTAITATLGRFVAAQRRDCLLCAEPAASWVCGPCLHTLPAMGAEACAHCAAPLAGGGECGSCLAKPPAFDAAVAAFHYRFPVDQLMHRYKYGAQLALGGFFIETLTEAVSKSALPDVVVAVPLSRARLAERGFNQAALIANGVARGVGVATEHGALRRVRDTQPQARLEWSARQRNLQGAFVAGPGIRGRHVALVDDVMTTGATLGAAAIALKQGGAARVTVWVAARAAAEEEAALNGTRGKHV